VSEGEAQWARYDEDDSKRTGASHEPSELARLWSAVAAVAAAIAGLGALVYFVGAATLWLALRNSGYGADSAIAHQSRSLMITLGLRGLFFVAVLTMVVALAAALIVHTPGIQRVRFRWIASVALVLVLAMSWTTWRWLAFAVVVSALMLMIGYTTRFPKYRRRWILLPAVIATAFAAIAWQYGVTVHVIAVRIRPEKVLPLHDPPLITSMEWCESASGKRAASSYFKLGDEKVWIAEENDCHHPGAQARADIVAYVRRVCAVPYFGESDDFIYVGAIEGVFEAREDGCRWAHSGPIVELRRDRVRLEFTRSGAYLLKSTNFAAPIDVVKDKLRSGF
jgi:hypothetical protein